MVTRTKVERSGSTAGVGIGARLAALLVLPLSAVLILAGIGVANGASRSSEASALGDRTAVALSSYRLVGALEAERSSMVNEGAVTEGMRTAVSDTAASLESTAAAAGDPALVARVAAVLPRVAALEGLTQRGLGGQVSLNAYSSVLRQLLDLSTAAIDPGGAVEAGPSATTDYLARARAAASEERDLITVLAGGTQINDVDFQRIMRLASEQQSYIELAAASAPPAAAVGIRQVGFSLHALDADRRTALEDGNPETIDRWIGSLEQRSSELAEYQAAAEVETIAAVDGLSRSARTLLIAAVLVAGIILAGTIVLLVWARRSIARPLQELAQEADRVAGERLPAAVAALQESDTPVELPPLPASGATEVQEVAHAFDRVQHTALELASEQAAMRVNLGEALTNLGRRNQSLLGRQLDFISTLERSETDPVFLDHLFKLDHLANRMRRNAESLLVLAGSETPRRRRAPAAVTEVVRSAMGEVEEYERVRIGHLRDATIVGPLAIDLVHLLAELLENALAFSPPDTTVEIDGRSMAHGGYQFAVVDHGVGMSDLELLSANGRLSGTDEVLGMPTKYLGQYVVAKLAAKIGAMVRLQQSAGGKGVTALVILPDAAIVGSDAPAPVAAPLPGSAAAREQGPVPFAPGRPEIDSAGHEIAPEHLVAERPATVRASSAAPPPIPEIPLLVAERSYPWPPPEPGTPSDPPTVDMWAKFMGEDDAGVAEPAAAPAAEPAAAPAAEPAAAPAAESGTAPAAAPTAGPFSVGASTRSDGLARRVPGKTLSDRSQGADTPSGGGDLRSADGVRSMLGSLQAGRARGRGADPFAPGATPGAVAPDSAEALASEAVLTDDVFTQDGRSTL